MDPVLAVALVISALCIGHLWWKQRAGTGKKVLWSAILLVPALGPLFYGAAFESLPEDGDAEESNTEAESIPPDPPEL